MNEVRIISTLKDNVTGQLGKMQDKFDVLGKSKGFQSIVSGVGLGIGVSAWGMASTAIVGFIGDSIKAGSDLNETMSKSAAVFKNNSDSVSEWGDTTAEKLGISKNAAIGAASGFGDLFNKLGLGPTKAKNMSQALVVLSSDLASFNNLDPSEVLLKLKSGLAGEAEPLRSLGVFLNEAKVKAKATEMGLVGLHGELSEGAKVQARYALILEETQSAQGDFARTSGEMAGQQRILNAELEDTSAKMGQRMVPAVLGVQKAALGLIGTLDTLSDGAAKTTEGQQGQIQSSLDLMHALAILNPAMGSLANAEQTMLDGATKAAVGFDAAGDNSVNMAEKIKGASTRIGVSLDKMGEDAADFRDKYFDETGDIIRRSGRMRDKLIEDAARVRGEVFDETEIRASLHDTRLELFALKESKRDAKTIEEKRQLRDEITQSLDDQGEALEDLAAIGKLTDKDIDRFVDDAQKNWRSLSKEGREEIQKLIEKYRLLANMPNISKTFTIRSRSINDTHGPGRGQLEFATGGVVPGPKGQPQQAIVHSGETVRTPEQEAALMRRGGTIGSGGTGGGLTIGQITVIAGAGSGLTAGSARQLAAELGPAIYQEFARKGVAGFTRGTGLTG